MMRHPEEAAPRRTLLTSLTSWLDAGAGLANFDSAKIDHIDWMRVVPFIGMHLACFAIIFVGVSTTAVVTAVVKPRLRRTSSAVRSRQIASAASGRLSATTTAR